MGQVPDGTADAVEAAEGSIGQSLRETEARTTGVSCPGHASHRDSPGTWENLVISLARKPGKVRPEVVGPGSGTVWMHRPESESEHPREGTVSPRQQRRPERVRGVVRPQCTEEGGERELKRSGTHWRDRGSEWTQRSKETRRYPDIGRPCPQNLIV